MLIEHKQITRRQAKTRGHNILVDAKEKPQCGKNPLIKSSSYSSNLAEREITSYRSQHDTILHTIHRSAMAMKFNRK